ncbi:MAG: DUF6377 domain-containing protein, partial [Bacteroides sp.]|nr:DUF6377 domain-containing protein [Bacteroides sp.]
YINNKIISQYQTLICDSAEYYIHENIEIAQKLGNDDLLNESRLELAFVYSLSGLFIQAHGILTSVVYDTLPGYLKCRYCWTYIRYYENLIKYTADVKYSDPYMAEINSYRNEVISLLDNGSDEYDKEYAFRLQEAGNYREALKLLLTSFEKKQPETHAYAMAAMSLAKVYALAGNEEEENYYLLLAAITDTQLAVKENEALLSLATRLYQDGRTDRAYTYIKVALEDANFFNSRFKNSVIARVQPIIENTYLQKIEHQKQNLRLYAAFITLIVITLVIALYFNYNQKKIIIKTREDLLQKNEELIELNRRLDEANIIKEKYIGYFINQNSVYIDKLERYRKDVNLKIKAGLIQELYKSSSGSFEKEIEDIYANFDKAFLELYPDFVEKFNALLKPDKRFNLPKSQLNAELRIFALIRLGITDVAQIALQLRLSTQTIYNYKSKIKKERDNGG